MTAPTITLGGHIPCATQSRFAAEGHDSRSGQGGSDNQSRFVTAGPTLLPSATVLAIPRLGPSAAGLISRTSHRWRAIHTTSAGAGHYSAAAMFGPRSTHDAPLPTYSRADQVGRDIQTCAVGAGTTTPRAIPLAQPRPVPPEGLYFRTGHGHGGIHISPAGPELYPSADHGGFDNHPEHVGAGLNIPADHSSRASQRPPVGGDPSSDSGHVPVEIHKTSAAAAPPSATPAKLVALPTEGSPGVADPHAGPAGRNQRLFDAQRANDALAGPLNRRSATRRAISNCRSLACPIFGGAA